jgi:hypothetical protein
MKIVAHILTCPERVPVLGNTLAALRATDWGEPPEVSENRDTHPDPLIRIQRGTRAVLERALAGDADFILFLEDDLAFNRHLRANLQRWAPLQAAAADRPFFASLFRPPGVPVSQRETGSDVALLPPGETYGNLALVLSRATARHALEHWDEEALEADRKLPRLAARLGPLYLHAPSLVQHLGVRSTWGGAFLQALDFEPTWRGGEASGSARLSLAPENAGAAMDSFLGRLGPCPGGSEQAGAVIAAGGLEYLVNAWVAVRQLRRHGFRWPIQLWHLGPAELPPPLGRLFQREGVDCVDAHARMAEHPTRQLGGRALKSYALLHAPFRHVLLLDADNTPVRDPSFLFDSEPYRRAGAIFWPDHPDGVGLPGSLLAANHPIWRICDLPYRGDPSFEGGQMVVDRQRCWRALNLASWMNQHADFWYQFLHGDKDTYQIAWRKVEAPWEMPADRPRLLGHRVFSQVDFEGKPLFQHRAGDKWRLDGRNQRIATFEQEDECRAAVEELRQWLFGELGLAPTQRGRLAPGQWLWSRPGRSPRLLTFHSEGFVEAGSERGARLWRRERGNLQLIGDDLSVTAEFRYVPRVEAWLGRGEGSSLVRIESGRGRAAPLPAASPPVVAPAGQGPLRAILCCAGEGGRWGNHLGVPKHLVAIDGTPLIQRTVRQLWSRGIEDILITAFDQRYTVAGAPLRAPQESILPDTGMGFSAEFWSQTGRTLVLLGDVYFSEAAIDAIVGAPGGETTWLGRRGRGSIDKYAEMFGVSIPLERQQRLKEAAAEVLALRRRGAIQRIMGWELYAVVNGLDARFVNPGPNWIDIDDETEDFDFPADYEAWMRRHRAAG